MSEPLAVTGPSVTLRYATAADAPRLLELASDPLVTRWFSWGPYSVVSEADAYIRALPDRREAGNLLDFVIDHREHGVIGVTGLSEVAARDRRATVGTWLGRDHWGSGANAESKALIGALAFSRLGFDRLTAWANTRNVRSQRALESVGYHREGVLRSWHRHGDERHDVVVFRLTAEEFAASGAALVPAEVSGQPPAAFVVG